MSDLDAGTSLALAGSLRKPLGWLLAILGIALVGITVAVTLGNTYGSHLHAPVNVFLAPAIILLVLLLIVWSLRRASVRVDQGMLIVNTGVGSKRVALADLRAHGLSVIDLHERTELRPIVRLWGTGLPGFAGGWFRLRNGEKAVCLLLDRSRVCYLRSDAHKLSLLLSLQHPETLRALLGHQRGL